MLTDFPPFLPEIPNRTFAGTVAEFASDYAIKAGVVVHVVDVDEYEAKWSSAMQTAKSGDSIRMVLAQSYASCRGLLEPKYLGMAPNNPDEHFAALAQSFPNFREFFELFEEASYGALVRKYHDLSGIRVLLLGPPGIGKTRAVEALAESLSLGCEKISVNALITSHELLGLGHTWANPTPGVIAKLMSRSLSANPIVILDELDKGATDMHQFGRSLDSMLELTEPSTAKAVRDQCLEVDIDLSHVSFIATANSTTTLPEPLLSRFHIIEVRPPSRDQMPAVLQSIYREVLAEDTEAFATDLSAEVIEHLRGDNPRTARVRVQGALGRAAKRFVQSGLPGGKPIEVRPEDLPKCGERIRQSIGFIQHAI